jgi:hypothetical protein
VDKSHRARSRLAEGLFERIAAWNGFGLILYGVRTLLNTKYLSLLVTCVFKHGILSLLYCVELFCLS